jgi:hypothetical protein
VSCRGTPDLAGLASRRNFGTAPPPNKGNSFEIPCLVRTLKDRALRQWSFLHLYKPVHMLDVNPLLPHSSYPFPAPHPRLVRHDSPMPPAYISAAKHSESFPPPACRSSPRTGISSPSSCHPRAVRRWADWADGARTRPPCHTARAGPPSVVPHHAAHSADLRPTGASAQHPSQGSHGGCPRAHVSSRNTTPPSSRKRLTLGLAPPSPLTICTYTRLRSQRTVQQPTG